MQITTKRLAEIAEKSPGYSVTLASGAELTNIRFTRRANGRRDRFTVEADYNGKAAKWHSDCILSIRD